MVVTLDLIPQELTYFLPFALRHHIEPDTVDSDFDDSEGEEDDGVENEKKAVAAERAAKVGLSSPYFFFSFTTTICNGDERLQPNHLYCTIFSLLDPARGKGALNGLQNF